MIKIILAVVALLITGVLIFAATKPNVFRVERKVKIQAPPEKVFALINDFRQWGPWSPWQHGDRRLGHAVAHPAEARFHSAL